MTDKIFWNLYDRGVISVKVFTETEDDGTEKEIDAFQYDGRFFLRITIDRPYLLDRTAECGKKYRMCYHNRYYREFPTKERANAYFLKFGNNLKRVK